MRTSSQLLVQLCHGFQMPLREYILQPGSMSLKAEGTRYLRPSTLRHLSTDHSWHSAISIMDIGWETIYSSTSSFSISSMSSMVGAQSWGKPGTTYLVPQPVIGTRLLPDIGLRARLSVQWICISFPSQGGVGAGMSGTGGG